MNLFILIQLIFFKLFNVKNSFLNVEPQFWDSIDECSDAKVKARNLKMINDYSERAVKLIEDYNSILTINENQKPYILQKL